MPRAAKFSKAVLLALLYPAAALLAALGLAGLNAWFGSLHMPPGESLGWQALALCACYALLLHRSLRRLAQPAAPATGSMRMLLVLLSTLVASPVIGLIITPALNGVLGTSATQTQVLRLQSISSYTSRGSRQPYYNAQLLADSGPLPSGRYFLGRYNAAWQPAGALPPPGTPVTVHWRRGLLGKPTVMAAAPSP